MRRVFTAAAAVAALALAISACGGGDQGTGGTAPPPATDPAAVSGTVTWWDTSDATNEAPAFRELIADFEAKYPNIKVNYASAWPSSSASTRPSGGCSPPRRC
jgi:arabinogalactan oligomer/maltooligosaccharide transport system substrate-binding protein